MADLISRCPAFVAAVQHGRGADVQLALPAPPLDTFETLGEPIKSGYTNDAIFQDVGLLKNMDWQRKVTSGTRMSRLLYQSHQDQWADACTCCIILLIADTWEEIELIRQ